ncbi:PBECR2 nuclease fold domain-containing protein [Campylobacter hyointestinalis]|uniref:PBECR2 nuclease fold domain-containing protein n=1 Tax=Campylobacter hyointestinalis TaxID=198 RepID=UPI002412BFB6|nr:PBECR2 nuclease fold domain-containing protein [Campylobacter hyointestinalis]
MRANFIVEKLKPLIPYLGNNEALKLHINRAILNANGDFKLAIKNIDNIPSGNLPTPTRNLLNEFKIAIKDIEQVVKSQEPTQIKVKNQANLAKSINGDGFVVSDENIKNLVKNISLNKYMAMQLQPKADLLNLAKDFSKVIKTPIFDSKISIDKLLNHLADKRDFNKRLEYLNLIKPTLENPLFITKENNRYRFIKTFIDSDKITKFLSVIENDNGEFLGITATPIKNTDLKNILKGDIVWGGDTLSTLNAPQIAKQEVEAIGKTIPNQTIKEAENLKTKASIQAKAKQYAKFLSEANEPTQVAPNELYKAYKAKKDLKNRKG